MISLIINTCIYFVIISIIYFCLNNYGFKGAWIVTAIALFIESIFKQLGNISIASIIGLIIGSCISSLIYCGICNFIYTRTTTFWAYALLSILFVSVLSMGIGIVIGGLIYSAALNTL